VTGGEPTAIARRDAAAQGAGARLGPRRPRRTDVQRLQPVIQYLGAVLRFLDKYLKGTPGASSSADQYQ
jgi:hypothetical protein